MFEPHWLRISHPKKIKSSLPSLLLGVAANRAGLKWKLGRVKHVYARSRGRSNCLVVNFFTFFNSIPSDNNSATFLGIIMFRSASQIDLSIA